MVLNLRRLCYSIFESRQWEDPEGLLALSVKQMKNLKTWVRAPELISREQLVNGMPDIATEINGYEVMQKQVGDCSVLSSLAVAAHFEFKHKYNRKLISWNLYPQDTKGNPVFNPAGHYVVKLFINGTWSGVHVDDYLPLSTWGKPLCAYSARGKLWVSLIEKAYLKVNGGYDFMGSNSSRDLYTLTGWLPEKVHITEKDNFDADAIWTKISTGARNNDCLITIGTGLISDEDSVGLVGHHAYGVLEVVEHRGLRMLLIKNPWGHFRWKGRFCYGDSSWTPELKQALGYDNFREDKGVFWMDFASVIKWFDCIDLNWNPELLQNRRSIFSHARAD